MAELAQSRFHRLPVDVVKLILNRVHRPEDLLALMQVDKDMYELARYFHLDQLRGVQYAYDEEEDYKCTFPPRWLSVPHRVSEVHSLLVRDKNLKYNRYPRSLRSTPHFECGREWMHDTDDEAMGVVEILGVFRSLRQFIWEGRVSQHTLSNLQGIAEALADLLWLDTVSFGTHRSGSEPNSLLEYVTLISPVSALSLSVIVY